MEIIQDTLEKINISYPLETIDKIENFLFIDIETTGFSARSSKLYLIGCVYFKDNLWNSIQFWADDYSDEEELISEFFYFARDYKTLVHFNGNNFDIPYLNDKINEFKLEFTFDDFDGIDLYKRVQPLKKILKLENCKQKTIEKFLKLNRKDTFSGGDLIGVYHEYVKTKDPKAKEYLLLHNYEDIVGLVDLITILSYCDIFYLRHNVTKVTAGTYKDISGKDKSELIMHFDLETAIPVPISIMNNGLYLSCTNSEGIMRVPIFEGELKYFFANYKDYYYLPLEDMAIHKSVSSFVDKSRREQAKASNCYTKKTGRFLMQWDTLISPIFKESYDSKTLYWEISDERKTDRKLFSAYLCHVLDQML